MGGNLGRRLIWKFTSQSGEDGTMGLLTCIGCDFGSNGRSCRKEDMTVAVESGDFWGPLGRGFCGLACKMPAEENADEESQDNLVASNYKAAYYWARYLY